LFWYVKTAVFIQVLQLSVNQKKQQR